ncbi:Hsp20/alpha crystallin family protein [Cohnella caldifontis]|uniref:Hsp20/alpha crystallin family protein n=1 Tax=Cohnella caldifontis TaxID=3027471 RepID=UPI0023EB71E5|nr:Hsp20/alpha crystallin family protein [Cohnella sp. YIM B05605]
MNGKRHPAMDWQQFQRDLMKQMPFIGKDLDAGNLSNFVQKAIGEFLPKAVPGWQGILPAFNKEIDYELFETHRSIFVRCKLPEGTSPRSVRFFATRRKLKIEHGSESQEIPLPSDINTGRTIARFHEGVLEIRMPKINHAEPFREIFIRDS